MWGQPPSAVRSSKARRRISGQTINLVTDGEADVRAACQCGSAAGGSRAGNGHNVSFWATRYNAGVAATSSTAADGRERNREKRQTKQNSPLASRRDTQDDGRKQAASQAKSAGKNFTPGFP